MMDINLSRSSRRALGLTVAAICLALLGATPASAETFKVSTAKQLEEDVAKANANGVANTIELAAGTYQPAKTLILTNTGGTQTIAGPVGSIGVNTPGAKISGSNVVPVEGVSEHELFMVREKVSLAVKHVVVTSGGGEGNSGIEDFGSLNVENSTISGNVGTQINVHGGATASLTNSTLSDGSELGMADEGTASFLNVTVVHNASGGIGSSGGGTLNLTNTIVALNGSPQCSGTFVSLTNDHSLASDASCGGEAQFQNKTPLLQSSLLNDGGSTTLYSEKAGSPTLDAGDMAKCPATDQRGYPRPDDASTACDIGADEYSPTPPSITVPEEIVTPATSSSGAEVMYSVEATDPDALVKSLKCLPESGSTFPVGTTKVECTATDGHENKATASFNVTVTNTAACAANPTVETQPSNQTVTEPAGASFNVKEGTIPPNCSAATIQWEVSTNGGTSWTPVSGANFSGATSATLKDNPTATSESGHEFRAVLTNAHSKTNSTAATLTVNPPGCAANPTVETQPSNQTVTEPAGASFNVKEGTIPPNCSAATIQWEVSTNGGTSWTPVSGANFSGATSATLKDNPTATSESGHEFRAVLTNAHSKTNSTAATLTVNPPGCAANPTVETQPSNQTVTEPAGASFNVKEGTIPPNCSAATIQWEVSTNGGTSWTPVSGANFSGATSATLKDNPTATSESGHEFRAVLTNAHSKTNSTAATLTVNPPGCAANPTVETQPSNQTVTEPAGASFNVKEGTIPPNCSAATIQWEVSTNGGTSWTPVSGANFSGATSATLKDNPTATSESGHEFRAVLTNAHSKTNSTAATLTVNPPGCAANPTVETQPSNQTVTEPAGASFNVKEGTIPPNCSAATIQWEVSTNGGTSWTPVSGANFSGATSATLKDNPTATSESGHEFRAVLTNAHSKTNSTAATLTVNPPGCAANPTVETQPSNQTVTEPAGASFNVKEGTIPPNCSAATIQWEVSTNGGTSWTPVSGANFSGATSATLKDNPTATSESGHEFRAVLTNAHSKTNSTAATLTVNPPGCAANPTVETQPSNQTVTEPAGASFNVKEGTIPPNCSAATIQWEVSTNGGTSWTPVSGANFSGATSATLKDNPTATSESGHEFRAVLTNAHSKTNSTAATLTVNPPGCAANPTVETQPSNQTVTEPAGASFNVKEGTIPPNCSAATIQWEVSTNGGTSWTPVSGANFSGATSATLKDNPTATSESGHEFRAVLTNAHSKTNSTAATLTVNPPGCAANPTVETQPSNQTVTEPAGASFNVKEGTIPPNCSAATIQWEVSTNGGTSWTPVSGANFSGATSATLKDNPTATSESGHEFRAVLTNAHSKTNSTAATLTVNPPGCAANPTVETQPSNQTVTEPAGASFNVKEGTIPPNCSAATIQWEVSTNGGTSWTPVSGANFSGATSATLKDNPTATSESGHEFRAVLTNAHSKTNSTAATLTVNAAASPEAAIRQLLQEVSSSTIPHGIRHKLSCLLSQALRSLAGLSGYGPSKCGAALLSSKATKADRHKRGHAGACEDLQQFAEVIEHDQYSRKPRIPAELGTAWSKAAHDIQASLGCTSHDKSPGQSSQHAHGHRGHRSGGR